MDESKLLKTHEISTIKDMIYKSSEKGKTRLAFQEKVNGNWKNQTVGQFLDNAENLACSLFDLGIKHKDKLGIIGRNRTDWAISYMAAAISGIITVPLDRELKEQEIYHTLHVSGAKAVVCTEDHANIIYYLKNNLPKLKHIICMDKPSKDRVLPVEELYKKGAELKQNGKNNALKTEVKPSDIMSMLFTSGTTGSSKIVPLTHKNICANIVDTCRYVNFDETDKWLSVLPMHHVYECTCGFLIPIYKGASVAFTENLYKIADNAKDVSPTIMLGVPALYESMLKKILSSIKSKTLGGFKLKLGLFLSKVLEKLGKENARKKIFHELHERFGNKMRLLITGGAAANSEVSIFFEKLGFTFIQGAGMTESSPIYALNPEWKYKHEAIGIPLPGMEIEILRPNENGVGEIAIKGANVFDGYYEADEINKEVFEDGWFKTGDLGYKDNEGYFYITGRKKNLIITSGGKNIYPEEIEAWLNKSDFILESLVWGGGEKGKEEVRAIIVPDFEYYDNHCKENNLEKNEAELKKIISKEVNKYSSELAVYKRVKKFTIRHEEFPKTTTKKIKRFLVQSNSEESVTN